MRKYSPRLQIYNKIVERQKKADKKMTVSKHLRSELHNDEARVWNMDITNGARRSYTMGYRNQELHVLNILNINGFHRNLSAMSPTKNKSISLKL